MSEIRLTMFRRRLALCCVAVVSFLVLGLAPQTSAARVGFFSPTGSLAIPTRAAVAAPLPDGRVLIAGGCCSATAPYDFSNAEIFNPATGTFLPTGSMTVARNGAVAAPLPDGRVLVAGGDAADSESSAELYNPATGTFSPTGPMTTARWRAAAAPLADGRVLVVGGYISGGSQAVAEIFNPATNTFSSAGFDSTSNSFRPDAVAAPLPDGRVLIAGGLAPPIGRVPYFALSGAAVFDPATNTFSSDGIGSMSVPRAGAAAAWLPDGRVLVAGGADTPSAELFNPATNSFSSAGIGPMSTPRSGAAAAPLPGRRVLVAGGYALSSAEVFTLITGKKAAALRRCKKRAHKRGWSHKRLRKCRKKAKRLPV